MDTVICSTEAVRMIELMEQANLHLFVIQSTVIVGVIYTVLRNLLKAVSS